MQNYFNPYALYMLKFQALLDGCRKKKDPALWLHKNNARVTLFMLESIARIIYKTNNDSETKKWYKLFKEFEDLLGKIDFYKEMQNELTKLKSLSKPQQDYLKKKKSKSLNKLNENLIEHDFYKSLVISLNKPDKLNINSLVILKQFEQRIKLELSECADFFNEYASGFNDMEGQVHEFRRKLRWISIYAQSLQGFIVLKPAKTKYKWEKELVPKKIISLPYNKLPINTGLKHYMPMNKTAFYALTFVIQELGIIKDRAFILINLAKLIEKTTFLSKEESMKLALFELKNSPGIEKLLEEGHILLKKFFNNYDIHKVLVNVR